MTQFDLDFNRITLDCCFEITGDCGENRKTNQESVTIIFVNIKCNGTWGGALATLKQGTSVL